MLKFFRKYQKFFFLFTTIIIISSFVFFGTYQAFGPTRSVPDEVAFHTLAGKGIKRSYLNQMIHFLAHEAQTSANPYRPAAGNFLNEGVITKDFLEGGLGWRFVEWNRDHLASDFNERLRKEKKYTPFVHQYVPSLSAEVVWGLFAPDIKENLERLQQCGDATDAKAFQARVDLLLAERRFPPAMLAQVLRYQERENQNIPQDNRLMRGDLSLFGYRNLMDWFGADFVEGIARFIFNAAAYAKEQGYKVTRDEALAELLYRSEQTYQQVKDHLNHPLPNSYAFFQEYLRQTQLNEETVVRLWQDILLFRRLFQDVGSVPHMDTLALRSFYSYANEYATIELFTMPKELHLHSESDLKAFEAYLQAVAPPQQNVLALPESFDSIAAIEKRAPELVGRSFVLDVAKVSKKGLQSKVSVKETWEWEVASANWEQMKQTFSQLRECEVETPEERFALLEKMEPKGREIIDAFARAQIVEAHPEWIEEALLTAKPEEKRLFLRRAQKKAALPSLSNTAALVDQLEAEDHLTGYTQDGETYFRIEVKERIPEKEVLSFAEAKNEEIFKDLTLDSSLITEAIYHDALQQGVVKGDLSKEKLGDFVAPMRFLYQMREGREASALWQVESKIETITRSEKKLVSLEEALAFGENAFSDVRISPKEGAYCFRVLEKRVDRSLPMDKVIEAQNLLSKELRGHFMQEMLELIEEKRCSKS